MCFLIIKGAIFPGGFNSFGTSWKNDENVFVEICKGTVYWKKSVRIYFSCYFKGPFSRFRIWAAHTRQHQIRCPPPRDYCSMRRGSSVKGILFYHFEKTPNTTVWLYLCGLRDRFVNWSIMACFAHVVTSKRKLNTRKATARCYCYFTRLAKL